MRTIRGRLIAWYAAALTVTVFVFATALYLIQRRDYGAELDDRVRLAASLISAVLSESYGARGELIITDPVTLRPVLHTDVASFLEGIPGYVVVASIEGDVLHLSADARTLPYGSLVLLLAPALEERGDSVFGLVDVGPPAGEIRYFVRPLEDAGPRLARVLAGASTGDLELGPRRLLTAMLLIVPFIVGLSTLIGAALVGRTLRPVDQLVDEVEAITDGRSLHRRLAPAVSQDELGRLTATLNAMLARLERSFGTLRRFTADASHELKTPLTVLRSGIERAITHPKVAPEVLEVLDETLAEVNRMAETVDSLLMLARADEGRAPLHVEEIDLRDLLHEVTETAHILGEQSGVTVNVVVPSAPVRVQGDRSRIWQLLMNLLTNAVKYTPAGGSVEIECARRNGDAVLAVRDTGIGIAVGDLPHIFDRFWRADPARSRTGQRPGVGLGLAICKWIAEAHGGNIQVQSRPGRGTTFTVKLPVAEG